MMAFSSNITILINLLTFLSWIALIVVLLTFNKINQRYRKKVLIAIAIFNVLAFWFSLSQNFMRPKPPINARIENGEFWDINTIFSQEKDLKLRQWKKNLLEELSINLNQYRTQKGLPEVKIKTIESFSPQKLNQALTKNAEKYFLLDVREPLEISKFHLASIHPYRYGDLANDIIPTIPLGKKVIVVCYSGIRGFIAANILREKGFNNIAFIRGGLGEWVKQNLPIEGEDTFQFLSDKYEKIPFHIASSSPNPKINFTSPANPTPISNAITFVGDLASTTAQESLIQKVKNDKVILFCKTESECFDAVTFAYRLELEDGEVLGYSKLK